MLFYIDQKKYNLLNIYTLSADNTAETRYDLITGGTDCFTIDFELNSKIIVYTSVNDPVDY